MLRSNMSMFGINRNKNMISILMGLHRLDEYVFPAIESILAQEEIELEFIIVANGKKIF